ncbi:MAG: glycosyltransferase family 4 protein [Candidatus Hermodarchaeota archaeon]
MKILLVADNFYPNVGGIANVLVNLCKSLKSKEHKIYVINPNIDGKDIYNKLILKDYEKRDFLRFFLKKNYLKFSLTTVWKILFSIDISFSSRIKLLLYFLTKPRIFIKIINNITILYPFLRKLDFDIIFSGNSSWILPLNFILSKMFKKKMVTIAYGLDFLVHSRFSLRTYYFRNTEKIIVITKQTKNLIKQIHHLGDDQVKVIYVGVNLEDLKVTNTKEELKKEFNIPIDNKILLSVGRHVERKNFGLVIRALGELKKARPDLKIKYYLVGEGPETVNLKSLSKNLNLEEDVKFLGNCDINTRNKFYKMADIFLMPSITKKTDIEGFGIVFLEANYFKVPTIGSKTGGIVEAIVDGKTGFLVNQNDLGELVEKILTLIENEEMRKNFGENGYKRVVKEFQWTNIVEDYIELFEKLIENKN